MGIDDKPESLPGAVKQVAGAAFSKFCNTFGEKVNPRRAKELQDLESKLAAEAQARQLEAAKVDAAAQARIAKLMGDHQPPAPVLPQNIIGKKKKEFLLGQSEKLLLGWQIQKD